MIVDHSVSTRSNPNAHDGTSGGGVGVAEMRERKEKGQGLPSPQVGPTSINHHSSDMASPCVQTAY